MIDQHTPGPWQVFYKPKYDEWHVSVPAPDGGMRIPLFPDGISSSDDPVEAEANARLIAAAPDLLVACEAFVAAWERSGQLEKTDTAVRLARAAIAKARGTAVAQAEE